MRVATVTRFVADEALFIRHGIALGSCRGFVQGTNGNRGLEVMPVGHPNKTRMYRTNETRTRAKPKISLTSGIGEFSDRLLRRSH